MVGALHDEHLLKLNAGRGDQMMFIIPGVFGISDGYDELAKAFGDKYTIYGIQMFGLLKDEIPLDSIEKIAAKNIEWIKSIQPTGPYRFVGHSFGGHVVYEMIKQLEKNREQIDFVSILDVGTELRSGKWKEDSRAALIMQTAYEILDRYDLAGQISFKEAETLKSKLSGLPTNTIVDHISGYIKNAFPGKNETIELVSRLFRLQVYNLLMTYEITGKAQARLIYIQASEGEWISYKNAADWKRYFENIEILTSPGDHFTMVKNENAGVLANLLLERIKR